MAGDLDESIESGRDGHLGAAVLLRQPEPEQPGVGQAVDEVAWERAVLLDLVGAGAECTGQSAGGVER